MFESWTIGVMLRATSNVATTMISTAAATARANSVIGSQNALLAKRNALVREVGATQRLSGGLITGFTALGVAAGAAIYTGIKGAADLQTAMISVGISTHTATNKMQDLYNLVMKTSGITAQSATTIGGELATASSAGLTSKAQLMSAFPQIAKAADDLWIAGKATGRSIDPGQAVAALSQLTHLFGAYNGTALTNMLNEAVNSFFVQPESISKIVTQGKLFIPLMKSAGVSDQDIWSQILMMGQSGFLRGRGGSGVRMALQRVLGASNGTIAGTLTAHQMQAARELRLTDAHGRMIFEDKTGHVLFQKMIDHLFTMQRYLSPSQFTQTLINWAGPQGGSLLAGELRPAAYAQYRQNRQHMNEGGGVQGVWMQYVNTFSYSLNRFGTNFKNLFIDIMRPYLPQLTNLFTNLGSALGSAGDWLLKNPTQAKMLGGGLFGLLGVAIVGIGATSLLSQVNIWKLNAALGALDLSAGAAAGAVGGVGAGNGAGAVAGASSTSIFARTFGRMFAADVFMEALADVGPYGWAALGAASAVEIAKYWSPLNSAITNSIFAFEHLPGPLHNFGVNLEAIARKLGIIRKGSILGGGNILNKNGDYVGFQGKHMMMSAGRTASMSYAENVKASMLAASPGLVEEAVSGIRGWWKDFTAKPVSILTDAQADKLERAYEQQNAAMHRDIIVHVEGAQFNFPPGTSQDHAKQFLHDMIKHAQTYSKTTSIRMAASPWQPASALLSP